MEARSRESPSPVATHFIVTMWRPLVSRRTAANRASGSAPCIVSVIVIFSATVLRAKCPPLPVIEGDAFAVARQRDRSNDRPPPGGETGLYPLTSVAFGHAVGERFDVGRSVADCDVRGVGPSYPIGSSGPIRTATRQSFDVALAPRGVDRRPPIPINPRRFKKDRPTLQPRKKKAPGEGRRSLGSLV